LAATVLALLAASPAARAAEDTLTDADLAAYAAKPFDLGRMMGRHVELGVHHGAEVVVDFPCSDFCPEYTVRIIHYAVEPGPACDAIGGVPVKRMVPFSIATRQETFCTPKVVAAP
jgi:hypothetical protein